MYKKVYESSEERRGSRGKRNRTEKIRHNRTNARRNKDEDELPEFTSYDDYVEYTKSDSYLKRKLKGIEDAKKGKKTSYWEKEPIVKKPYVDIDYTMDGSVKQLFLNLTKMSTTFEKESTLEEYLPTDIQKDEHGNYFYKIGDSKTMFCCHLDVYCKKYERVYHIIEDDIIMTNGTTILGGDDKAGMVIMLKMIESKVPGLYYFFRGEEGTTSPSGTWGSKSAIKSHKDIFTTYEKCIAFDRRGFKSIISKMMYNNCCSDEFVNALIQEFKKAGMEYEDDKTGVWTDSGVFMETIPECTNISVGYLSEHTHSETQDIKHLEELCAAVIKINWDGLPVKRDPTKVSYGVGRYKYDMGYDWDDDNDYYRRKKDRKSQFSKSTGDAYRSPEDIFFMVADLLETLGYECINPDMFQEAEEMYFQNIETTDFFGVRIINSEIYMSDDKVHMYTCHGNIKDFKKYVMIEAGLEIYDEEDEDEEEDTANGTVILDFGEQKIITFNKIVETYPNMVSDVIKILNKNKSSEIDNNLWLRIDKIMSEGMGLKMDYSGDEGYTPDDFVEWVFKNLDTVTKKHGIKIEKSLGVFKEYIDDVNEYYSNKQDEIFCKIVENERELVKLVLKDIEIRKQPTVREATSDKILDAIKKLGYGKDIEEGVKKINSSQFVLWVYDYTDQIGEFYTDLPF